ncbi:Pkinase-domain-containing protein [Testicularia cyperi]|uniref:cyclin-dependent kinase n=1 Tax=Testicularia cyperi TaxID=1882483 RepID=A0A317XPG4_9BASI|nr:Pkinase-domain-containing protein [Testicularia cyperi]
MSFEGSQEGRQSHHANSVNPNSSYIGPSDRHTTRRSDQIASATEPTANGHNDGHSSSAQDRPPRHQTMESDRNRMDRSDRRRNDGYGGDDTNYAYPNKARRVEGGRDDRPYSRHEPLNSPPRKSVSNPTEASSPSAKAKIPALSIRGVASQKSTAVEEDAHGNSSHSRDHSSRDQHSSRRRGNSPDLLDRLSNRDQDDRTNRDRDRDRDRAQDRDRDRDGDRRRERELDRRDHPATDASFPSSSRSRLDDGRSMFSHRDSHASSQISGGDEAASSRRLAPRGRYDDDGRRVDDVRPSATAISDARDPQSRRGAIRGSASPPPSRSRYDDSRKHTGLADREPAPTARNRDDDVSSGGRVRRWGAREDDDLRTQMPRSRGDRHYDRTDERRRRSPSPARSEASQRSRGHAERLRDRRGDHDSRQERDRDDGRHADWRRERNADRERDRDRETTSKADRTDARDRPRQTADDRPARWRKEPSPDHSWRGDRDRDAHPSTSTWARDDANDRWSSSRRGTNDRSDTARDGRRDRERSGLNDGPRTPPRRRGADADGEGVSSRDSGFSAHVLSRKPGANLDWRSQRDGAGSRDSDRPPERSVRGNGWQTVRAGARKAEFNTDARNRDDGRGHGGQRDDHAADDDEQSIDTGADVGFVDAPRAGPGEAYESINQVGEGTYGQVFKARSERTGIYVALKKIRMEGEREGFPITAMREIKLLQALRHENIVRLHEIMVTTRGSIYMVFEYMEHDLNGILAHPTIRFSPAHVKSLALQLMCGLEYLHKKAVLHRDLKGSNILLNNQGRLKLADFGLARFYAKRRKGDYTNRVVTLWYRPPELLFGETQYGPEVDMWGAGCIFLELFVKKPVFQGEAEIQQLQVIADVMGPFVPTTWPEVDKLAWYEMVKPTSKLVSAGTASNGADAEMAGNTSNESRKMLTEGDYLERAFRKYMDPAALEVARGLLTYDPAQRWSATHAISSSYFSEAPRPQMPSKLLTELDGEWHEYESRRAKKKATANATVGVADRVAPHHHATVEKDSEGVRSATQKAKEDAALAHQMTRAADRAD